MTTRCYIWGPSRQLLTPVGVKDVDQGSLDSWGALSYTPFTLTRFGWTSLERFVVGHV